MDDSNQTATSPWCCMHCNLLFDSPRRLSFHVKNMHKDIIKLKNAMTDQECQRKVQCNICGAVLNSALAKHMIRSHGQELEGVGNEIVKDPCRCSLCHQLCCGEKGLRKHLYRSHGAEVAKQLEPLISSKKSSALAAFPRLCDILMKSNEKKDSASQEQQKDNAFLGLCDVQKKSDDVEVVQKEYDFTGDVGIVANEVVLSARPAPKKRRRKQRLNDITDITFTDNAESPLITFCSECKLELLRSDLYKVHLNLRHKPVQCPLCAAWLKGKLGLDSHDDLYHQGAVSMLPLMNKK